MASLIVKIDYPNIPQQIEDIGGYNNAYVLVYLGGQPAMKFWAPVRDGRISHESLHQTLVKTADKEFLRIWLENFLGKEETHKLDVPAHLATIAICTRDRPADLERCLRAIQRLPDDGQEVLVVDSCSTTDQTREIAESNPGVRYVREKQPGLNRARNRAIQEARFPIVAFCDDDAQPEAGWLRALTKPFSDPTVMCVTGLTLPIELETRAQEWFERYNSFGRGFRRKDFDKNNLHPLMAGRVGAGANMAMRAELVNLFGPFDEALDAGTPAYSGGDTEMYTRLLASGYHIIYEPRAISWHRHRREWRDLRKTVYGYGVGTYAVWTKKLVLENEFSAIIFAAYWFIFYQLPALLRSFLQLPGHTPLDLLIAELTGCLAGPWAYFRSRRLTTPVKRRND
ncbi:MAG TPA: glycosyltransferase [Anaerolineales bacterium]|nr:glycosyltransferase [Anaerolineales bacterium]